MPPNAIGVLLNSYEANDFNPGACSRRRVSISCDLNQMSAGRQVGEYEDDEVAIERSRYTRALSTQLKKLYDDAKSKGQPIPVDITENLEELKLDPVLSKQTLPRTVIHKIYPPSNAPFESLQLTTIDKLQSHTVHRGKFLLVYTVAEATNSLKSSSVKSGKQARNTFIFVPVFDKAIGGDKKVGAFLELHNCFVRKPLDEVLPKGTTLYIKEPFYSLCTSAKSNKLIIRVDHPTDIEVLYPFAAEKPESHWKRLGDAAFGLKRFHEAAAWYTKGIDLVIGPNAQDSTNLAIKLKSNRAAAYLELGRYDACIRDCDLILENEPNFKAEYRRAKAFYHLSILERPQQTVDWVVSMAKTEDKSPSVLWLMNAISSRIAEAAQGTYNWGDMLKEAESNDYLDRSNYQSLAVEVQQVAGKGNGVIAKESIAAGTLLVVSKASAIVYEHDRNSVSSIRIDTVTDRCDRGEQNELSALLTQHIYENRSRKAGIYNLYPGPGYEDSADQDVLTIDSFRMYGVQVHNSFESEAVEIQLSALPARKSAGSHKLSTGIWRFPSYFNHSCLNNCTRLFVKDMLIIKAARDIVAGEELTLGYVNKLHDLYERQACCQDFGFVCTCDLCNIDGEELTKHAEELKHREALEEQYQKSVVEAMLKGSLTVNEMKKMKEITATLVFKLRASYVKTGRTEMRYGLLRPLNALCTISIQLHDWQFAMTAAKLIADLSPRTHAVDDLRLGIGTLIVGLHLKFLVVPADGASDGLDESLREVVQAWKVRGLVSGFGGYWEEFGDWFTDFLNLSTGDEKVRQRILRAFLY